MWEELNEVKKSIISEMNLDKQINFGKYNDEMKNLYLLEGINSDNGYEERIIIYDCHHNDFDFDVYRGMMAVEEGISIQVLVFHDWQTERKIYYREYKKLKAAKDKRLLTTYFENTISIYVGSNQKIKIEVDNPINYLEYYLKKNDNLGGYIYNISFFELKKLYNVTGKSLFKKNVRNGIKSNVIGKKLKKEFEKYLFVYIFQELMKKFNVEKDGYTKENLMEKFELDEKDLENYKPEKFWFYHNGITIFSYDNNDLNRSGSYIELNPKAVSVINGAQTLNNFYMVLEDLKNNLKNQFDSFDMNNVEKILENATKLIKVKTIIIYGEESSVKPITYGLNTQIPIMNEHILADSKEVDVINKKLRKKDIEILKEGEISKYNVSLNVIDFLKKYLIVKLQPGMSKNFRKSEATKTIREAEQDFKDNENHYVLSIDLLNRLDGWWKNSKKSRESEYNDDVDKIINSYGKNYFGSYLIDKINNGKSDYDIDDQYLEIFYNNYLKDFKKINIDLTLSDFKKDELFCKYKKNEESQATELNEKNMKKITENDLKKLLKYLKYNIKSSYSVSKVISDYLDLNEISIPYFRTITRVDKKAKESYPFPNSTFTELYMYDDNSTKIKNFAKSKFRMEVCKKFPVFVIEKSKNDSLKEIKEIKFIPDFSFEQFLSSAEKVYNKTVDAFEQGEIKLFTKSSDDLDFHIRPKAIDSYDTFEFSNGEQITKRTFWANKKIIDDLINKYYIKAK